MWSIDNARRVAVNAYISRIWNNLNYSSLKHTSLANEAFKKSQEKKNNEGAVLKRHNFKQS